MKETVGIGIIGTGFARRVQIPAFNAAGGCKIVSISSGSIENARAAAEEFDIPHYTDDYRKTILHPEVDLVCITTPPRQHCEMTLFAVENDKHILCEKPMAMNLDEAKRMAGAVEGYKRVAVIDHELRFQASRQMAFRVIREGQIGKVFHAKAIFRSQHRIDPEVPWNWWSDAAEGGGALGAIGSHIIDSFLWFLGTDISSVSCQLQTHVKERRNSDGELLQVTSDDEASLLLRFANSPFTHDATGLVSISMAERPDYENVLEFHGVGGALRIDEAGRVFLAKPEDEGWTQLESDIGTVLPGVPDSGFSRGFVKLAPQILSAIRSGDPTIEHAATFADGVRVQMVLDAARKSNETGASVLIDG